MTRPKERIPPDERLFRRLRDHHRVGQIVLPEAVDLDGSSCDRERYRNAQDLIGSSWPHVAWVTAERLPREERPPGQDLTWEFFAVDEPLVDNGAHCEIRVRRTTRRHLDSNDSSVKKRSHEVRAALRAALASRFAILDLAAHEAGV